MIRITLEPDALDGFQAIMPDGRRLFHGRPLKGGGSNERYTGSPMAAAAEQLLKEGMPGQTVVVFRHGGALIDATQPRTLLQLKALFKPLDKSLDEHRTPTMMAQALASRNRFARRIAS
jgi:hypothetical protein